jgi:hypothetical protein
MEFTIKREREERERRERGEREERERGEREEREYVYVLVYEVYRKKDKLFVNHKHDITRRKEEIFEDREKNVKSSVK